jgi:hypothetical protein
MPSVSALVAIMAAAGTLLGGVAAVLSSLPKPGQGQVASPIVARLGHIRRAETFASWSVGFGACALLLAGGFVALVGMTTAALGSAPVRALVSGSGTLALLGLGCVFLTFQQSIAAEGGAVRPWRASAGLAISAGALAALLIAGS